MTKTTLITGGTSGIGLALAKEFAKNKFDLVITGRTMDRLEKVAAELRSTFDVSVLPIENNLSNPQASKRLHDSLAQQGVKVDVLVNNAGFGAQGAFVNTDLALELDMIQVNITALTELVKLFLPGMIARGQGKILNVASTAAFQPGPFFAVYFATKAYVLSFTEAIAEEARGTGVTVTALCPGPTATDFAKRAGTEGKGIFRQGTVMAVHELARIGYQGLMSGQPVVIAGWRNQGVVFLLRLAPRRLVARI